jgi:RimJ/RimL family protein N-acetyltransferase
MAAITIRPSIKEDAGALLKLARLTAEEGFGLASPKEFSTTEDTFKKRIAAFQNLPQESCMLTAEAGETVVGQLSFFRRPEEKYRHHGSFSMSLFPEWRGRGAGHQLVESFLFWADTAGGLEKITLEVLAGNESAQRLYRNFGFIEEGRLVRHVKFRGRYEDLLLMARLKGRHGFSPSGV